MSHYDDTGRKPGTGLAMDTIADRLERERKAVRGVYDALAGIIEIGKRDLTNPKYDGYFTTAREALAQARAARVPGVPM